jgi:hypothetical protein
MEKPRRVSHHVTLHVSYVTSTSVKVSRQVMASFLKTKLKAARDAIAKKDYKVAEEAAGQVLEYEPANYNALV